MANKWTEILLFCMLSMACPLLAQADQKSKFVTDKTDSVPERFRTYKGARNLSTMAECDGWQLSLQQVILQ